MQQQATMELIIDILNAAAKSHGREATVEAVEMWLTMKKGEKFLEANPGLSFGDAPVARQRALSAEAAEYVPIVSHEGGLALLATAAETLSKAADAEVEEGLEQLATAMAATVLEGDNKN